MASESAAQTDGPDDRPDHTPESPSDVPRDRLERQAIENAVLAEIGLLMTTALNINEVYERFADQVARLLPFDRVAIADLDLKQNTMTTTYTSGLDVPEWAPSIVQDLYRPLTAMVFESRSAIVMDEEIVEWVVTEYPAMQHLLDAGLRSTLALPMYVQDEPIAFFALNSRDPQAYTAEDAEILERVVAQVSGVLANARLRTELREEVGRRTAMAEIGRQVGSSPEVGDMFQTLEHLVKGLIDFDRFTVTSVDTDLAEFRHNYISGEDVPGYDLKVDRPLAGSMIGLVARDGKTLSIPDLQQSLLEFPALQAGLSIGLNSAIASPMHSRGQLIGALLVASKSKNAFSAQDLTLLERVAAQVEGAIANALLHQQWQSEAEERLKRLEELDQLRLQFLQMVTHEFRTPLASLRVSRDLLAETPLENLGRDAYSRLVNNMGRGVDRLDRLVTDLLDLTIAQAGELSLNIEPVEIDGLINDAVEIVSPLISQRQQDLKVDIEIPAPIVDMDRQRIEQVILNLLSNAQKYTDDNASIDISANRRDSSVVIRVTGHGPDVPAEDTPHLFEPFFRGSGQAARRSPGRGLGLAIARAFVELHGGNIGFESIATVGPSFYFTLPLTANRNP